MWWPQDNTSWEQDIMWLPRDKIKISHVPSKLPYLFNQKQTILNLPDEVKAEHSAAEVEHSAVEAEAEDSAVEADLEHALV